MHYATADAGPNKNPVADDLELRSIPTDVELLTKGNFDDMGINLRHTPEDSKVLSSILHHESSQYQSQSALSMMQNQLKQIEPADQLKAEALPTGTMARQETADSGGAQNHLGFLDKPISFGKDFATKETLGSAQRGSLLFNKAGSHGEAQSPPLQSQPSPQFERQSNQPAAPKAGAAPPAPAFNRQLMMKIREKTGQPKRDPKDRQPGVPKHQKEAGTKFVSVPIKPLSQVSEGSIFHQGKNRASARRRDAATGAGGDADSLDKLLWTSIKKHFQKP